MAQAQLEASKLWLEIQELGKEIPLPIQVNTEEKYFTFLGQTSTVLEFNNFMNEYLGGEVRIGNTEKVIALITTLCNHLKFRYPQHQTGFEKVKQYFCQTVRYVGFICREEWRSK